MSGSEALPTGSAAAPAAATASVHPALVRMFATAVVTAVPPLPRYGHRCVAAPVPS
ncbi:hypothetical protein PUR34_39595 [Streptomyces sp. JV185]|uniref:hypothetical protein n=1 Tax=Streptomyces sp. JV185 TaxID=858638 RepID=UPI002E78005A|nr:hypothetical protein [Streptomyces sp. JV185]MEE1774115.1 hypothetical protein [Streptomyces sp. JV185]